jgi:hypothetical protein
MTNQEFKHHLETLMQFKTQSEQEIDQQNVEEIEQCMSKLIEAAKEMRELQID